MAQKLQISEYKIVDNERKNTRTFSIRASGKKFQITAFLSDLKDPETRVQKLKEVNEQFRNSLRYLKHISPKAHAGKFPTSTPKHTALTTTWSHTETGIAIRPIHDMIPEFQPFYDEAHKAPEKNKGIVQKMEEQIQEQGKIERPFQLAT